MPLNSPIPDVKDDVEDTDRVGVLYVVATPIGNMEDITLRALRVLATVDGIAAEDTRRTGRFLSHHGITTPLISYHEHNEHIRTPALIKRLAEGSSMALVTDAGTPAVSDPGYRLVRAAITANIQVVPVPGVSAAMTALCAAGLPTDSFVFVGFVAKKKGKRLQELKSLARECRTLIFYESPKRIMRLLAELHVVMGDRNAVLCREMTKLYEEFLRGTIPEILAALAARDTVKGECTLLIAGLEVSSDDEAVPLDPSALQDHIADALEGGGSLVDVARQLSKIFRLPRREVYEMALKIKGKHSGEDGGD